jgi:BolA family transcriptional regulator, general stress-responsive regulator
MTRMERIEARLREAFGSDIVELTDESHLHAGHAGAKEGKGHFRVRIVSGQFRGLGALQRHQLVYRQLGALMQTDIHAMNIAALAPEDVR